MTVQEKKIATIATFYSAAGEFNHLTVCLRKMGRWQKKKKKKKIA